MMRLGSRRLDTIRAGRALKLNSFLNHLPLDAVSRRSTSSRYVPLETQVELKLMSSRPSLGLNASSARCIQAGPSTRLPTWETRRQLVHTASSSDASEADST